MTVSHALILTSATPHPVTSTHHARILPAGTSVPVTRVTPAMVSHVLMLMSVMIIHVMVMPTVLTLTAVSARVEHFANLRKSRFCDYSQKSNSVTLILIRK